MPGSLWPASRLCYPAVDRLPEEALVLPLHDKNPSESRPFTVYALIAVNVLAFLYEVSLPRDQLLGFIHVYGVVPGHVTAALNGEAPLLPALVVPVFASMFLHGGWMHLLGNMWFLHIFGDNVEDRLGHFGFLLFYLFCGLTAVGAHYALAPDSSKPVVGASGAIAGVLGAYAVRWPRARVLTLLPVFIMIYFVELPALVVLGMWFAIQFLQGTASIVQFSHGGVAYWAHVGGFVTGAALIYPVLWLTGSLRRSR
jgi:membrane associated rhomboid family serine protease